MRSLLGFVLAGICSSIAHAAIPARLDGLLLHRSWQVLHTTSSSAILFSADGAWSETYRLGALLPARSRLSPPASGTYIYQPLDARTATLALRADDGTSETLTLHFESDTAGFADAAQPIFVEAFHFSSTAPAVPLVNSSNRSHLPAGGTAFAGFVLTSSQPVLVRAVGPGLEP